MLWSVLKSKLIFCSVASGGGLTSSRISRMLDGLDVVTNQYKVHLLKRAFVLNIKFLFWSCSSCCCLPTSSFSPEACLRADAYQYEIHHPKLAFFLHSKFRFLRCSPCWYLSPTHFLPLLFIISFLHYSSISTFLIFSSLTIPCYLSFYYIF